MKTVHVRYFAQLKEVIGLSEETVATAATTAEALYEELRARHGLKMSPDTFRVAINTEFCEWNTELHEDDTIVFLPPVAGG